MFNLIVGLLCIIATICAGHYYWSRRKLYELAAKLPGPTGYPIIGSAYLFISLEDMVDNALAVLQKYGSTLRLWMFNVLNVIVANPKHVQIILNSPHCLEKEKRYMFAKEAFGNGLLTAPVDIWKHHRKIINPSFSPKVLNSFMDTFVEQTQVLMEQLKSEDGNDAPFDVREYLCRCVMDIICETAMGIKVEAQTKPSKFLHGTKSAAKHIVERAMRVWLHPDFIYRWSRRGQEFYEVLDYVLSYSGKLVSQRYEEFHNKKAQEYVFEDNARKPFLEHLLTLGDVFTHLELRNEVDVFITAGLDTVASSTSYVLVCLGMHPDIQEKLLEELDEIFGKTDRNTTLEDLPKLVYMERVIKETMRLYSPVPFIARSVTEDVDLGDFVLPAGVTVTIPIAGAHRDPESWLNPTEFNPDRFLPQEVAKRHTYSYIPFSGGPRNCIGKLFAMMTIKVILSSILRTYKIHTCIRPEDIKLSVEITSKMVGGSNITITRR